MNKQLSLFDEEAWARLPAQEAWPINPEEGVEVLTPEQARAREDMDEVYRREREERAYWHAQELDLREEQALLESYYWQQQYEDDRDHDSLYECK